jgi:hypothetical protein
MKTYWISLSAAFLCALSVTASAQNFKVVGTGVTACYDTAIAIPCPVSPAAPFYGQFHGVFTPAYHAEANGTVSDLNTGLMWQRSPDQNGNNNDTIELVDKLTWPQIQARVATLNSTQWGGFNDWRIPTIKELYSLTHWSGTDPSGITGTSTAGLTPFLDSTYFPFAWGQTTAGERLIDVQYASQNLYSDSLGPDSRKLFGFNFADGRIKGYGLTMPGGAAKVFSFIAVRGNAAYGINNFVDNGDSTITDAATGLTWTKYDSREGMNWQSALAWAQAMNAINYCGHSGWRLPNAKELQTIVDYTRSPGATHSAAINPLFACSTITNEAGLPDWPWFWTSTTHRSYDGTNYGAMWGVYVCFGRAAGWMQMPGSSFYSYTDVHGAGAQRSSPKRGTFLGNYIGLDSLGNPVYGLGPQGDILRINNYARLVRGGDGTSVGESEESPSTYCLQQNFPNPFNPSTVISFSLPVAQPVVLTVFDILGREIATLAKGTMAAGSHRVTFDAGGLPSGVYYCRLTAGSFISTKKMILMR